MRLVPRATIPRSGYPFLNKDLDNDRDKTPTEPGIKSPFILEKNILQGLEMQNPNANQWKFRRFENSFKLSCVLILGDG